MTVSQASGPNKPLHGQRVIVPRGGAWGDSVAALLRDRGAIPIIAPMINFAPTDNPEGLTAALAKLADGGFDWVTVTSATTVDVLSSHRVAIPEHTKIAAVGETTAAALLAAGYRVDAVPSEENSGRGLLREWQAVTDERGSQRVLALRSSLAKPLLSNGLADRGHQVEAVIAYRTVAVPIEARVLADVHNGRVRAVLVTSGSVAEQVRAQLEPVPDSVVIACIGPQTAKDARGYGLRVDLVAPERTAESLVDALARHSQNPE